MRQRSLSKAQKPRQRQSRPQRIGRLATALRCAASRSERCCDVISIISVEMITRSMPGQRPSFLFIGPDRAGSTWLYETLSRHKQAYMPNVKEFFFFDRYYHRGWRWYESYFKNADQGSRVIGEISHDYLFS